MHNTSSLYQTILAGAHRKEIKVVINNVTYDQSYIVNCKTSISVFNSSSDLPNMGGCTSAQLDLSLVNVDSNNIPKAAEIKVYYRLVNNTQQSEWIQKGIFYIDTRSIDKDNVLEIHAYDAMIKTENTMYLSAGDQGSWPKTDSQVVSIIATAIGCTVDSRTTALMNRSYTVEYPGYGDSGYTIREVLGFIGTMYGGNWVISDDGALLLISLYDTTRDTYNTDDALSYYKLFPESNTFFKISGNTGKTSISTETYLAETEVYPSAPSMTVSGTITATRKSISTKTVSFSAKLSFKLAETSSTTMKWSCRLRWSNLENNKSNNYIINEYGSSWQGSTLTITPSLDGQEWYTGSPTRTLHIDIYRSTSANTTGTKVKTIDISLSGDLLPEYSEEYVDDGNTLIYTKQSSASSGLALNIDNPWATQAMVNNLYTAFTGYIYKPFQITEGLLDPALEIGDKVAFKKTGQVYEYTLPLYSLDIDFGPMTIMDGGAPEDSELAHEYKSSKNSTNNMLQQVIADLRTSLSVTDGAIESLISGVISTYKQATDPSLDHDMNIGDMWYDTVNDLWYRWNGNSWEDTTPPSNVAPDWEPDTSYAVGDVVTYNNTWYRCTYAHTSGSTFNSAYWAQVDTVVQAAQSKIDQTIDNITLSVTYADSGSYISLTSKGVTISSQAVDIFGQLKIHGNIWRVISAQSGNEFTNFLIGINNNSRLQIGSAMETTDIYNSTSFYGGGPIYFMAQADDDGVNDADVTITGNGLLLNKRPAAATSDFVLACDANGNVHKSDKTVDDIGGGGGVSDYDDLTNRPQINGVTLTGNKTTAQLGIVATFG